MIRTGHQLENALTLKSRLISLYEYLMNEQDGVTASKVKQLGEKLEKREFTIAFCGHFSAGKSTMINTVIGEKLLPSSPIPTSANLVRVKSGEEYAKVFFKKDQPRLYLAPYDYELVKNFCKDGDQIEEIEISHNNSSLPENAVIMDTPGIDSADDAHRIATESAIHLADLVFYVMDYNHVQAELNFLFTRELTQSGKDIYLVINQIDKHQEEELSFRDFKQSVKESFASWGVKPAGIYYTSLKDKENPQNQFGELKNFIQAKLSEKDELLTPSIISSMKKLALDHLSMQKIQSDNGLLAFMDLLEEIPKEEQASLPSIYRDLITAIKDLDGEMEKDIRSFEDETETLLKNAYLMPYQTRELAESYLESCQSEFKVGFLFSKQKTLDEKNSRLERFYEDIHEKAKSQLEWHIREFLLRLLKNKGINEPKLNSSAQSFTVQFQKGLLESAVKPGARLSGDYVLNYTKDVANEILKLARNQLSVFKEEYREAITSKNSSMKKKYENESAKVLPLLEAYEKIKQQQEFDDLRSLEVNKILTEIPVQLTSAKSDFFHSEEEDMVIIRGTDTNEEQVPVSEANTVEPLEEETVESEFEVSDNPQVPVYTARLKKASGLVADLPGFSKIARGLMEKADRLENRGFTVALFGAFSAGKSSFANALIGEKVLPVSPNPTTAAINKIKPISDQYGHGTVLVKVKDPVSMLEDVNRSLNIFEESASGFQEALERINVVLEKDMQETSIEKTHFAFLLAFKNGYQLFEDILGETIEKTLADFADFVAKEEKSCFVEWIELYYDCELTRKGITLVDTPGADSINARHTGVAFEYIKNSDAILFVTYYNHAFSRADREFLIQLGRVKESFQLDKMFFIINAVDLAENEEEKNSVTSYLEDQLLKFGIRKPHLFPLSSLLALQEKEGGTRSLSSGMKAFEREFYHFISHDLADIALTSAKNELIRLKERIRKLIQSSLEDDTAKEKKRVEIEIQKTAVKELIGEQSVGYLKTRLSQETEELIFYIKQRVFLRFSDFFKESFNPSQLKDDGRNMKKALNSCLEDLLESLGFDFAQEMRATLLRLEQYAIKLMREYKKSMEDKLAEINSDLSFSEREFSFKDEIEFTTAFNHMNKQEFSKAMSYFKNPKSFFEKNEKKHMSEELYTVLQSPADEYLILQKERLQAVYERLMDKEFSLLLAHLNEQADDFYVSLLTAMEGGILTKDLESIEEKINLLK